MSDTISNDGLSVFLKMLSQYIEVNIRSYNLTSDSLYKSALAKINENSVITKAIPPTTSGEWEYLGEQSDFNIATLEKNVKVKWLQIPPFNAKMEGTSGYNTYGGRAAVGSGVIAAAYIMSYHKRNYNKKSVLITESDWARYEENPSGCDERLQTFLNDLFCDMPESRVIKSTEEVFTSYKTITTIEGVYSSLIQNGYYVEGPCSYDFNKLNNALIYGPTVIFGCTDSDKHGYMWIVEGTKTIRTEVYDLYQLMYNGQLLEMRDTKRVLSHRYVKFNWARGGNSDGWVSDGVFTYKAGDIQLDYSNNVKIIPMIRKFVY